MKAMESSDPELRVEGPQLALLSVNVPALHSGKPTPQHTLHRHHCHPNPQGQWHPGLQRHLLQLALHDRPSQMTTAWEPGPLRPDVSPEHTVHFELKLLEK